MCTPSDNVDVDDESGSDDNEDVDYFADHGSDTTGDSKQPPLYDDFFDAPEPDTTRKKATKTHDSVKAKLDVAKESKGDDDGEASEDGEGVFPDEDSDEEDMAIANEPLSTHEKKLLKVQWCSFVSHSSIDLFL